MKVETSLVARLTQRGNLTLWKPPLAAARQGGDGELATGVCSVNTSIPRQPAPTSHKLLPTNLSKEKKVKPLLSTDEPLCENNKLACGDSICISKDLFCDGKKDCTDGSDENACGEYSVQSTAFPNN